MQICMIGTGYVGLVSAACFAEMGNNVICVDKNHEVIKNLKAGKIHIYEPGLEEMVGRNYEQGRLSFTTELSEGLENALFIFIAVGTPSKEDGSCDLSYVYEAAAQIAQNMQDYKIIVDKSTVPVGTAAQVKKIISKELASREANLEFDVVSNPEFLKEGDAINDFLKPDRVVVGTDNVRVAELLKALYDPFARSRDKLIVMSIRSAEMTKYAANCMLATKISFINEIANICERIGADVRDVRVGIGSDSRIGYQFIYPGVGYGGSCFPKDVKALIGTAKSVDYSPRLLLSVEEVNQNQKVVLAEKVAAYFSQNGDLSGKTLAIWGLAFKANTDDVREASSFEIIKFLTSLGVRVQAFDPVAKENAENYFSQNDLVEIMSDQYAALDGADALAVVTEWNQFRNPDFKRIKEKLNNAVIFDGRNLYSANLLEEMGYTYFCIGRPDPKI